MACGLLSIALVPPAAGGAVRGQEAPTRWPYPIVVTGTPLALTERAAFYGTYTAWWTQTPAAPWPWPSAQPVTATEAVGVTMTASPTPARPPTWTPEPSPTWLNPCTRNRANCNAYLPFAFLRRPRR